MELQAEVQRPQLQAESTKASHMHTSTCQDPYPSPTILHSDELGALDLVYPSCPSLPSSLFPFPWQPHQTHQGEGPGSCSGKD